MKRWLFLPNSVLADLSILANLPADSIDHLINIFKTDQLTNRYLLYLRVAETLGISDQDAASLCSFWDYVQDERSDYQKTGADVVEEFLAFLRTGSVAANGSADPEKTAFLVQKNAVHLARVFDPFPQWENTRKVRKLEKGPLPHASRIQTFCDLRPIFDEEGADIVSVIPVVILRIVTHAYPNQHKETLVQLTEGNIDELEAELNRLKRKLSALKVYPSRPFE